MKLLAVAIGCALSLVANAAGALETTVLDPFLVRPKDLGNLQLQSFLGGNPNLQNYDAADIAEDGVSAGIVVVQTSSSAAVTIQNTTGTSTGTLLDYSDTFLTQSPQTGAASITISNLWHINGSYYAVALFQVPAAPPLQQQVVPANLEVTQGGAQQSATVNLILPPVLLVHGLWGDASSLSFYEQALDALQLWYPQYVVPICYSKYLKFDATRDPLGNGKNPCEVTSQAAVETAINSMLGLLDTNHVVGGRVDIVAHSMGGLVARHYASLANYASDRNRMQGQLHTIVTLDTPEIGSLLANYLIQHRNNYAQAPPWTTPGAVWLLACGTSDVAQCFASNGYPLYGPGLPVNSGAVYSLEPGSPSLTNPNLSPPDIANSTWLAVSAQAPGNSALATGLDTLIAALYQDPYGNNVPTVNSLLKTDSNDAIVTLASQIEGAPNGQFITQSALSHTYLVGSILTLLTGGELNDNNVQQDPGTAAITACWLSTAGASQCLSQAKNGSEEVARTTGAGGRARVVDGIRVVVPSGAELGSPTLLAVRSLIPGKLPQLVLSQRGETGRGPAEALTVERVSGDTEYVHFTPKVLGAATLRIVARFSNGAMATQDVSLKVHPPKAPPLSFEANVTPVLVLNLSDETRSAMPRPVAVYAPPVGRVFLNPDMVAWHVLPQKGAPVIAVDSLGTIQGLRPGEADVEAQFGGSTARLHVIVRDRQQ